jgi:hypothetical protein
VSVLDDEVRGNIVNVSAGTAITVAIGREGEAPGANTPTATTATGAGGSFAAAFSGVDLSPLNLATVEVASGDGRVWGYLYPDPPSFAVVSGHFLRGYADPGQDVAVTVYEGHGPTELWSGTTTARGRHGYYQAWLPVLPQAGDLVEVDLGGGQVLDSVIADLGLTNVAPTTNEIDGTAPAGETVTIRLWQEGGYAQTRATADGSAVFAVDLTGVADLRPRDWLRLALADADGNETQLRSGAPYIDVQYGLRNPWDCALWRVDQPSVPVTLTLQTTTDVYTRALTSDPGNAGLAGVGCFVIRHNGTYIQFSPGDTFVVESPTWRGSVNIAELDWAVDTAADVVTGTAPPGDVQVTVRQWSGNGYPVQGAAWRAASRSGAAYTASFAGFDVRDGGSLAVQHYDAESDFGTLLDGYGTTAYQTFQAIIHDVLEGVPPSANEPLTATLSASDGTSVLAETTEDHDADPWRFRFHFGDDRIEPGRWVTLTGESGWEAGVKVPALTVEASPTTDLITGEGPKSLVFVRHGYNDGADWSSRWVPVDDYIVDEAYFGADIQSGDDIHVLYQAPNGNRIQGGFTWSWVYADYTQDRAGGIYDLGHTFWITATRGDETKATATAGTAAGGSGPHGAFRDGFVINPLDWSPPSPDLRPGDIVHFSADNGYTNTLRIGTIAGWIDAEADTASGWVEAPWLASEVVDVGVGSLGFDYEDQIVELDNQGWGDYLLDFAPTDLLPDMRLNASYGEPDMDRVFREVTGVRRIYIPTVVRNG